MAHTTFTNGVTLTEAAWFQDVDTVAYTLFGNGTSYTGVLTLAGTTQSTSTTTGQAIISGGMGLAKNLWVGGTGNFAGAVTLQAALTYGGVTLSNAVTGTGNMVLSNSPTFVTPILGVASATSINFGGGALGNYITPTAWTPVDSSGAGLTFTSASGQYVQIGKIIFYTFQLAYPATGSGANALIGGLPQTSANTSGANNVPGCLQTNGAIAAEALVGQNVATITPQIAATAVQFTNTQLSGLFLRGSGWYVAA